MVGDEEEDEGKEGGQKQKGQEKNEVETTGQENCETVSANERKEEEPKPVSSTDESQRSASCLRNVVEDSVIERAALWQDRTGTDKLEPPNLIGLDGNSSTGTKTLPVHASNDMEPSTGGPCQQIFVRKLHGWSIKLNVQPVTTIMEIKEMIEEKKDIPSESQRLLFAGIPLEGWRALSDYNVPNEGTLYLMLSLRKGLPSSRKRAKIDAILESETGPSDCGAGLVSVDTEQTALASGVHLDDDSNNSRPGVDTPHGVAHEMVKGDFHKLLQDMRDAAAAHKGLLTSDGNPCGAQAVDGADLMAGRDDAGTRELNDQQHLPGALPINEAAATGSSPRARQSARAIRELTKNEPRRQEVKDAGHSPDSTIYELEDLSGSPGIIRKKGADVRCPIDGEIGAAYVHCLVGSVHAGPATHMLSYTWGYTIGDIVGALVDFCKKQRLDPQKTYFWICFLCVNQHRVAAQASVSTTEFLDTFAGRVSSIGKLVCLMSPWQDPVYLRRVWCIFEMSCAFSNQNCGVDVALPPREKLSLINDILLEVDDTTSSSSVDILEEALDNINVEEAEASQEADRAKILAILKEQAGGYDGTNARVREQLKEHIVDILVDLGRQCRTFEENLVEAVPVPSPGGGVERGENGVSLSSLYHPYEAVTTADEEWGLPSDPGIESAHVCRQVNLQVLDAIEANDMGLKDLLRQHQNLQLFLGFIILLAILVAVAWPVQAIFG